MSLEGRIESLKTRHADLERAIQQENSRPHPDDQTLSDLKRRKLKIKEELSSLEHA